MAENEYKKLPGKGWRSQGLISLARSSCTLWLGADHLLQIDSQGGYTEDYKRFYFQDIQAITVRKTSNGLFWSVLFACLILIFAALALAVNATVGSAILWSIAGLFALFLVIHLLRGATCDCQLRTAVQSEQLPSLKRLRNAQKTLATIRPLIEAAQGSLAPETLVQHLTTTDVPASAEPLIQAVKPPGPPRHPLKPYRSAVHPAFFAALTCSGLVDIIHLFFHPPAFIAFESLLYTVVLVLAISCLAKQHGTDIGKAPRTLAWFSGGYLLILLLISYAQMIAVSFEEPGLANDQWGLLKRYAELEPLTTPWLLVLLISNVVIATSLGLAGLLTFRSWRAASNRTTVSPIPPLPPT